MKALCPYPFIEDCNFKYNGWCSDYNPNSKNSDRKCVNDNESDGKTRSRRRCPFIDVFDFKWECVYLERFDELCQEKEFCEDLYCCPGNGDSWCSQMIEMAQNMKDIFIEMNEKEKK